MSLVIKGVNYNLLDIVVTAEDTNPPASTLSSVNMLDPSSFPITELLEKTTLDKVIITPKNVMI